MEGRERSGAVETLLVIILLLILSVAVFALASSGGRAYGSMLDNRESFSRARVAILYINVKIRQNDESGSISLSRDVIPETETLLIRHPDDMLTFIFFDDGAMWEGYIHRSAEPSKDLAMKVCSVDRLDMQKNGESIQLSAGYVYNKKEMRISSSIYLRSESIGEANGKRED